MGLGMGVGGKRGSRNQQFQWSGKINQSAHSINQATWRSGGKSLGMAGWWGWGERGGVGTRACLSAQVTNQSGVQGLFQDVWPMELGHVQGGGRGAGVAGSGVALAGDRGGGHVQGGGGHVQGGLALLVVLAVTLLVQGQGQALPLLPPVAEPNSHHLRRPAHVLKPTQREGSGFVFHFERFGVFFFTYVSLQAQVVWDVCDLLGVWFGTLHEVRLQSRAHRPLQAGPPLPFSGVHKHALDLVHLQEKQEAKRFTRSPTRRACFTSAPTCSTSR